jgi:hypothetical protein
MTRIPTRSLLRLTTNLGSRCARPQSLFAVIAVAACVAVLVFYGFMLHSSSTNGRETTSAHEGNGEAVANPAKGSDPDAGSKLIADRTKEAESASAHIQTETRAERSFPSDESLLAGTKADHDFFDEISSPAKPKEYVESKEAIVGHGGEGDRNPDFSAEAEQAATRAYPAADVSFQATLNAQQAWASAKSKSKNVAGQWQLIGPSKATYPSVLNVLGDGDQYVASGRITSLAIAPTCTNSNCRLYLGAAGGGVWRTTKALAGNLGWEFVSGSFATNAIGSLTIDPNDPTGKTVYAGTGESHASGDSEAGMGIYKTTNGGDSWTLLPGSTLFQGRSLSSIAITPSGDILVGVARGIRGYSGNTGGATSNPPVAAPFGLYRSTDGGATFTMIWNGAGSIRGVNAVALDPNSPTTIYSAAYQVGVWRSTNNGATFMQIKTPLNAAFNTDRAEFAVNALPGGFTRMYIGVGNQGAPAARFYRTDDAAGAAVFADMTTAQNIDYCTGQCWYDNFVVSPKGYPDIVYLGGSYDYATYGRSTDGRGVLLSSDGGAVFSDVTWDGDPNRAEAIHPDQHTLVVHPNDPYQFFEGSDGGMVRTDGRFADVSYKCDQRGLTPAEVAYCKSLLWRVPDSIVHLNEGLSTLQFNSLSVSSQRPKNNAQGGTQDNGTFQHTGSSIVWWQEMYGDGGQSGFNVADDSLRFNTFFGQANDVNFRNGDPTAWCVATGPIVSSPEGSNFYPPIIADPNAAMAGSIFQGSQSVWRTQDWGGPQAYLEANCPEFTTSAANPACGDFVRIGPPGATNLSSAVYGGDRTSPAAPFVSRIARAPGNTGTVWAATNGGRLFISDNADAPAASVVWTRLDPSAANDPGRFISGIYVDPANPNHAWVSYSGYNFNTPAQPGHVFEVIRTGATATWVNLDGGTGPMGDLPVTDIARDDLTGTLYASTDFGVLKLVGGTWVLAGQGMPMVEVAGLTIVPSERLLYAATHGRAAWKLTLP